MNDGSLDRLLVHWVLVQALAVSNHAGLMFLTVQAVTRMTSNIK